MSTIIKKISWYLIWIVFCIHDFYFAQQVDGSEPPSSNPRLTGSMVPHNDDIVTRMKNVEMIELGYHRIRPWYFSPYPQVRLLAVFPKSWDFDYFSEFRAESMHLATVLFR